MAHYVPVERRLTVRQSAEALGVSVNRMRFLVVTGRIRAFEADSPHLRGRRQRMIDALDLFALQQTRPWRSGRPRKVATESA